MRVKTTVTVTYWSDFDDEAGAAEFSGGACDMLRAEVAGWVGDENVTVHASTEVAEPANA